ncbi:uncharacterized protein CLUP02_10764 [Colletotrichum lupini]|uniref:Uncharacterized protein n=1 Tax=Colletotrichum lupini TaxID=145971 RepID=A0A9Q8WJN4_9PEZI|nr:uncharacterized protein CLUP02_10764 [Colletotrichum lupini]UQC85267.1 hypothetical protein CLUP02_10764 [Colletotrichum lupini]
MIIKVNNRKRRSSKSPSGFPTDKQSHPRTIQQASGVVNSRFVRDIKRSDKRPHPLITFETYFAAMSEAAIETGGTDERKHIHPTSPLPRAEGDSARLTLLPWIVTFRTLTHTQLNTQIQNVTRHTSRSHGVMATEPLSSYRGNRRITISLAQKL